MGIGHDDDEESTPPSRLQAALLKDLAKACFDLSASLNGYALRLTQIPRAARRLGLTVPVLREVAANARAAQDDLGGFAQEVDRLAVMAASGGDAESNGEPSPHPRP